MPLACLGKGAKDLQMSWGWNQLAGVGCTLAVKALVLAEVRLSPDIRNALFDNA